MSGTEELKARVAAVVRSISPGELRTHLEEQTEWVGQFEASGTSYYMSLLPFQTLVDDEGPFIDGTVELHLANGQCRLRSSVSIYTDGRVVVE
jgi:hypothetical protein